MRKPRACIVCNRNRIIHGHDMCESCYKKQLRDEKKSQGICTMCKCRPIDHKISTCKCEYCFTLSKKSYLKLKTKRLNAGCCVDCGQYANGHYRCNECIARNRSYIIHEYNVYKELFELQAYLELKKEK